MKRKTHPQPKRLQTKEMRHLRLSRREREITAMIYRMGEHEDNRAVSALTGFGLRDEEPAVRLASAWALDEFNPSRLCYFGNKANR